MMRTLFSFVTMILLFAVNVNAQYYQPYEYQQQPAYQYQPYQYQQQPAYQYQSPYQQQHEQAYSMGCFIGSLTECAERRVRAQEDQFIESLMRAQSMQDLDDRTRQRFYENQASLIKFIERY